MNLRVDVWVGADVSAGVGGCFLGCGRAGICVYVYVKLQQMRRNSSYDLHRVAQQLPDYARSETLGSGP